MLRKRAGLWLFFFVSFFGSFANDEGEGVRMVKLVSGVQPSSANAGEELTKGNKHEAANIKGSGRIVSAMREPFHRRRRLVGCTGRTSATARDQERMQELALIKPSSTVHHGQTQKGAELALQREFEEQLAECGPLTYRVAFAVLRSSADAEEVGQEALLRAYRRFDRLRDRNRFRAWLVRITFRLALDRARSARRRQQRETLWAQPGPVPTTEELAAATEFQAHLDRGLAELPPKLRLVLLLSAMQGHTLEEVAAILALPLGTVKSRLFLARKRLAEKLRCHVKNTERQ